jgi:periplasmic protein TonB
LKDKMKPWQSLMVSVVLHAAILSIPVAVAINIPYPPARVRFIEIAGGGPAGEKTGARTRRIPARAVAVTNPTNHPKATAPAQPKTSPMLREKPAAPVKSRPEVHRDKKPHPHHSKPKASPNLREKPAVPAKSRPEVHRDKKTHRHFSKAAVAPRVSRRHETRKQPTSPAPARAGVRLPAQAALVPASSAKPAHLASGGGAVAGGTAQTPAASASAGASPITAELGAANGPRFIHQVKPDYPRLARRLGKEGTVLLRVTIDKRGRPIHVQVVKGAGYGFDDQARRAVQDSLFAPAREAGRAVCCKVLLPVRFVLRSSS